MPNQYTKVQLFLVEDSTMYDTTLLSESLTTAIVDILKDIIPKDIESLNNLIETIKTEL